MIWGLYGTKPVLTVVALNRGQTPGTIDLAEKEYVNAVLLSDNIFEIEINKNVAVRIATVYNCNIEKIIS